jgi:tetratricopeptide (TPR) repeat protein
MADPVSAKLVEEFDRAASLASEGRLADSLAVWDALLAPAREGLPRIATGDFLGQAMMRRAWVLMDLGHFEEARTALGSAELSACLGQFDPKVLYEYCFSYGNTLGTLGDLEGMEEQLSRALTIAAEELGDLARSEACWRAILVHATTCKAYELVAKEAASCLEFAHANNLVKLRFFAAIQRAEALLALDRRDQARRLVEGMLGEVRAAGAEQAIAYLEDLRRRIG